MKEKIYFKNSKGDKLCGVLSNPTDDTGEPVIILCHGLNSHKGRRFYCELEEELNKKKISTFKFDFHSHGESEGNPGDVTVSQACDDILNAIDFLKKSGYSKIGLMGSSFGGMASVLAASKTDDLFLLALKAPVSNYEEVEKNIELNPVLLKDAYQLDAYKAAEKVSIPCFIVHGDKDELIPIEQSRKIAGLMKDCKLEIINGADHLFSNPGETEKVLGLIVDFIIKQAK